MSKYNLTMQQTDLPDNGKLLVNVISDSGQIPVEGATVDISYTGEPDSVIEELTTDDSGQTDTVELSAPPLEYSVNPSDIQPYSEYTIRVTAPGYEPMNVTGSELLPDVTSLQTIRLHSLDAPPAYDVITIPDHTLYGNYPPKIFEDEVKPEAETGEIVLSRVVIPEYVIVHDGAPSDPTASNYYVRYKDYIKNVVSSEIYATWDENAIYANTLAILSFTLNRVYTEWSVSGPF